MKFFSCASPTTSSMQSLSLSLFCVLRTDSATEEINARTHSPRKTPSLARTVIDLDFGSSSFLRVLQPCRAARSTEQKSGQCSLLLLLLLLPGMLEKWRRLVPNGPVSAFSTFLLDLTYIKSSRSGHHLDQDL